MTYPDHSSNLTCLSTDEVAEHLRQLCLLRHHVTSLADKLPTHSAEHKHLAFLRRAIDRHQAYYTGNPMHFARKPTSGCQAAND